MSLKNNTNYEESRRMVPAQGGHEPWELPSSVAHLPRMPLYLTVAWWGLHLGRPFTRHDVSRTFRITPRRASGVMAYIAHRCGTRIDSEFVLRAIGSCQEQMVLKIHSVENRRGLPDRLPSAGRVAEPAGEPTRQEQQARQRELAQWVLSRPRGGAAALTAWQARCPVERDAC